MAIAELNPAQLELLKLFDNPQTAEDLIGLRKVLHDFVKKKNKSKDQALARQIFKQVKEKVLAIDPDAKVILFGSRARGDARKDSDWDFLILTKKEATFNFENEIRDAVYDIELEIGEVISSIIFDEKGWEKQKATQFFKNIKTDSIKI
jgi:uncharacterized protein